MRYRSTNEHKRKMNFSKLQGSYARTWIKFDRMNTKTRREKFRKMAGPIALVYNIIQG